MTTQAAPATRRERLPYLPQLDGLRAISVSIVLLHHAFGPPSGGYVGVDIFFVLSGFLISTLLIQEWGRRGSIDLGRFYLRRALRLYPALIVLLVCHLAYETLAYLVSSQDRETLVATLRGTFYGATYLTNIAMASEWVTTPALGQLWSLATIEQFYLLWAPVLVIALRLGARPRHLALLLGGLITAFAIHRLRLELNDERPGRLYFAPDGQLDVLLVGCLASVAFTSGGVPRVLHSARGRSVLSALAAVFLAYPVLFLTLDTSVNFWGLTTVLGLASAVIVLAIALDDRVWIARALRLRPLVLLGRISYGVFLWQQVIIIGVDRFPAWLDVILSIAAGAASYVLVERPFLRLKRRSSIKVGSAGTPPVDLRRTDGLAPAREPV